MASTYSRDINPVEDLSEFSRFHFSSSPKIIFPGGSLQAFNLCLRLAHVHCFFSVLLNLIRPTRGRNWNVDLHCTSATSSGLVICGDEWLSEPYSEDIITKKKWCFQSFSNHSALGNRILYPMVVEVLQILCSCSGSLGKVSLSNCFKALESNFMPPYRLQQ